ncbi:MAG: hypothetical protein QM671_22830 [Bacillus sp. (in: firmicutes)]|uniref:hypothetical protein n=1 Tax=Bacillus sp. TaxID=1409 RepID=UPI0039E6E943
MLKKKMVGPALCLGILTGGGTFIGNMPVQAAEAQEKNFQGFTVKEYDWKLVDGRTLIEGDFGDRLLIGDCDIPFEGYSDEEIITMLDLKKGDKVQVWVTGTGSVRESYPGQLKGKVFKLRNMTNGKILENKNISIEDVK